MMYYTLYMHHVASCMSVCLASLAVCVRPFQRFFVYDGLSVCLRLLCWIYLLLCISVLYGVLAFESNKILVFCFGTQHCNSAYLPHNSCGGCSGGKSRTPTNQTSSTGLLRTYTKVIIYVLNYRCGVSFWKTLLILLYLLACKNQYYHRHHHSGKHQIPVVL